MLLYKSVVVVVLLCCCCQVVALLLLLLLSYHLAGTFVGLDFPLDTRLRGSPSDPCAVRGRTQHLAARVEHSVQGGEGEATAGELARGAAAEVEEESKRWQQWRGSDGGGDAGYG